MPALVLVLVDALDEAVCLCLCETVPFAFALVFAFTDVAADGFAFTDVLLLTPVFTPSPEFVLAAEPDVEAEVLETGVFTFAPTPVETSRADAAVEIVMVSAKAMAKVLIVINILNLLNQ